MEITATRIAWHTRSHEHPLPRPRDGSRFLISVGFIVSVSVILSHIFLICSQGIQQTGIQWTVHGHVTWWTWYTYPPDKSKFKHPHHQQSSLSPQGTLSPAHPAWPQETAGLIHSFLPGFFPSSRLWRMLSLQSCVELCRCTEVSHSSAWSAHPRGSCSFCLLQKKASPLYGPGFGLY